MNINEISAGLDIGSVSAKIVAQYLNNSAELPGFFWIDRHRHLLAGTVRVLGSPVNAAHRLLKNLFSIMPPQTALKLKITGSQGSLVAKQLNVPIVNEFKAIARGTVELVPECETILEIGGDGSRYLNVSYDKKTGELSILDYERNGECAAGTGSFIDQQAVRLKYDVNEIGPLVMDTASCASIAGRCSVFAKSDMIHAQQRGFSPGAIFKGLCEAVVRNYKGTVLRGKQLNGTVAFVGGVAANSGVVQAVRSIFKLEDDQLIVPNGHSCVAALGCAVLAGGTRVTLEDVSRLSTNKDFSKPVTSYRKLDSTNVIFEAARDSDGKDFEFPRPVFLGIDIGSVSTNLVLLDVEGHVVDEIYTSTQGRPVQVVTRELKYWQEKWGRQIKVLGVGTTGSGRELIGELVGADCIHDEITAHKTGADAVANRTGNHVDTIFEIGGQDSKFISIEDGIVVDFTMNEACAAGTGSFLEEQAVKLGISIKDDFARLALASQHPLKLGERCTVFMEKDVTAYMQQGHSVENITAGLAFAVVQNYLNRVVRGRKIGDNIYFQGGTAYNRAVAAAFATTLGKKITVPPHNGVIGAIGAALLAQKHMHAFSTDSRFRGFDLEQVDFNIRHFTCKGCSNHCEMQEVTIEGERTYWGDKCSDRYRKKRKVNQKPVIPDLFEIYHKTLLGEPAAPNGLDIKIGMPRTFSFYDRFPFWRTYFAHLGAELLLSDATSHHVVAHGRELCIAEPCFPVVVGHGHVVNLLQKNVDFAFFPVAVNAETDTPELFSWYCPWGQTLPLVIKNSLASDEQREKLLSPVIRFRYGRQHVKEKLHPVAKVLGVSKKLSDVAVDRAYEAQSVFQQNIEKNGRKVLDYLQRAGEPGVVIVGRPYNIFDFGVNLSVPDKLREYYGINVIPMDFVPFKGIDIQHVHENMFWHYGRRILQTAVYVSRFEHLHLIYLTNFKCGPDSYIKHFVRDALGEPFLTLQFDGHGNDAGIMTRCEAFLQSKGLLRERKTDLRSEILNVKN